MITRESLLTDSGEPNLWLQHIMILLVCLFSFFIHITIDELEVMEARNFVTAREMVTDGSWLLPTMNGELRIAKPPLPTWITAFAIMMGGSADNMLAMRIPAAVTATLMVFLVFGFLRTLTHKDPLLPFIIATLFAVNAYVIVLGRRNSWDIYAHFFMMATIWALWVGWEENNHSFTPFVIAGISSGLSFLSKGPVDFYSLLLPFSIAYGVSFGFKPFWQKKSKLLLFIVIAFVISAAWPLYVYINIPKASMAVAHEEVGAWKYDWARPIYYYLNFPLFAGAWIILLVAYFIKPFSKPRVQTYLNYFFPLIWFLATLVLLSLIPSKKERYLMPASIPMSMMIGLLVHSVYKRYQLYQQTKGDRLLINLHTGLMVFMSLTVPVAFYFLDKNTQMSILSWSGLVAVYAIIIWLVYKAGKNRRIISLFALTQVFMCISIVLLWPGISMKDHKNKEFKSIRELRHVHNVSGLEFYSPSPVSFRAVWDIGQKVLPWEYDKESIPPGRRFVLFFGDRKAADQFAADYGGKITFTLLDEYKYDPTKPDRSIVAALVQS